VPHPAGAASAPSTPLPSAPGPAASSGARLSRDQRNFIVIDELGLDATDLVDGGCPVCYGELDLEHGCVLPGCGHAVCLDCVKGQVVECVQGEDIRGLVCPEDGCASRIPYSDVMDVLAGPEHASDREKYKRFSMMKYERFSVSGFLAEVGNSVTCPFDGCQVAFIVEHGSARVDCPHCKKSFCNHCPGHPKWHADSTCEKYQDWVREDGKGDSEFEKLLKSKAGRIKPCPKCKTPIWKPPRTDGGACNWLRCRCRHTFCFLCLKGPLGDDHYAHFKEEGPCKGHLFYDAPDTLA